MALTPLDVSQAPSNQPNILVNGGFEVWQRGNTFNGAVNAQYTADRWKNSYAGSPTVNMTRETTTVHDGLYSMKVAITVNASGLWGMGQNIENFEFYKGKTVTFSCWINTDMTNINLVLYDGLTLTAGNFHTGNSTWQQLSVTKTFSASASGFTVFVTQETTGVTGTLYVDSAMCVLGTNVPAFIPDDPFTDLARCQRFFVRLGGHSISDEQIAPGQCYSTTQFLTVHYYPVPMRVSPTITVNTATGLGVYTSTVTNAAVLTFSVGSSIGKMSAQGAGTTGGSLIAGNATFLFDHTGASVDFNADL